MIPEMTEEQEDSGLGFIEESDSDIQLAKAVLLRLGRYVNRGLPSYYNNFEEQLYDMYPSLSWNKVGFEKCIRYLVENGVEVALGVKAKFGFDIMKDWKVAYIESRTGHEFDSTPSDEEVERVYSNS